MERDQEQENISKHFYYMNLQFVNYKLTFHYSLYERGAGLFLIHLIISRILQFN